jgi:hypothetical protein
MRTGITAILPVLALAVAAMGAGPCEMLDLLGEGADGGVGDCPEIPCANQLDVRIIRADNEAFWTGQYWFAIGLLDGSSYSVDCWLADEEAGFECDLGDTGVLYPYPEAAGGEIGWRWPARLSGWWWRWSTPAF